MKTVVVLILAYIASALAGDRTLILLDNWGIRETHSQYFKFLKGKCIYLFMSSS